MDLIWPDSILSLFLALSSCLPVLVFLILNPFLSGSASSDTITVIEPSHGRSTSDTVRFRDATGFDGFTATVLNNSSGYAITKVDDDTYTFTASSGTATTGEIRGGGGSVTAGPATLGT